jgi:hypothetical protein
MYRQARNGVLHETSAGLHHSVAFSVHKFRPKVLSPFRTQTLQSRIGSKDLISDQCRLKPPKSSLYALGHSPQRRPLRNELVTQCSTTSRGKPAPKS